MAQKQIRNVIFIVLITIIYLNLCGERGNHPVGGYTELEAPDPPLAALTFDDGPGGATETLLDGLALREVPATFFLVGSCIPGREELVRRMAQEGHQIGVHTEDHVMLTEVDQTEYDRQVNGTRERLRQLLGPGDYWLRPPYGMVSDRVRSWSEGPLILWSVDPEDWKDRDTERIVRAVLEDVQDGDIILLHDLYPSSVDAALEIVDKLEERGFCLVTVEQLMELRETEPEPGAVITELSGDGHKNFGK